MPVRVPLGLPFVTRFSRTRGWFWVLALNNQINCLGLGLDQFIRIGLPISVLIDRYGYCTRQGLAGGVIEDVTQVIIANPQWVLYHYVQQTRIAEYAYSLQIFLFLIAQELRPNICRAAGIRAGVNVDFIGDFWLANHLTPGLDLACDKDTFEYLLS